MITLLVLVVFFCGTLAFPAILTWWMITGVFRFRRSRTHIADLFTNKLLVVDDARFVGKAGATVMTYRI
jgi:hypothetical protein